MIIISSIIVVITSSNNKSSNDGGGGDGNGGSCSTPTIKYFEVVLNKVLIFVQLLDENGDNLINFKEFVSVLGIMCKDDVTARVKLLYQLHLPPALLPSDPIDPDDVSAGTTSDSPKSEGIILLFFSSHLLD